MKNETVKLLQKVLTGAALLGLTTAAVFPHAKSYIDSLPKHLTVEEAGKEYLAAACPINKHGLYLSSLSKKYHKETNTYYYIGSDAMSRATQRIAQLDLRLQLAGKAFAQTHITASKKLNNPKIVWPESVAKEIKEYSTHLFTVGGVLLVEKNLAAGEKISDKNLPSKIRQNLGLPPIGQGCK